MARVSMVVLGMVTAGWVSAAMAPAMAQGTPPPIGVEPCDTYLNKYRACIAAKASEADKHQQLEIVERSRRRWSYLAANPTTKPGLPAVCDSAWEAMKIQLSVIGCQQ